MAKRTVKQKKDEQNFTPQDEYIRSLELSVNILRDELNETIEKLNKKADLESKEAIAKPIRENQLEVEMPTFSNCKTVFDTFNTVFAFLAKEYLVVDLDIFIIADQNIKNLDEIHSSENLKALYKDLEERGLIEWAFETKEVKILPNTTQENEAIKSILIIPIIFFDEKSAIFLANSAMEKVEIEEKNIKELYNFIEKAYYLIHSLKKQNEIERLNTEQHLLRNQIASASNQLAISEIILMLSKEIKAPLKIGKTNLELIAKGIGDINKRIDILAEQFAYISGIEKKMSEFRNDVEQHFTSCSVNEILDEVLEIIAYQINRYGVKLTKVIETKKNQIKCFKTQIIFAIANVILYSANSMPEGGQINIGVHNSDEKNTITILITDTGLGLEAPEISNNIISLVDLSEEKVKSRFLFLLSQHILLQHNGKFSIFPEIGRGTTYKIELPVE